MICCAIYARYSSNNQREASIEDQIRKCREFAKSRGWEVLEDHIYFDKAVTGSSTARRHRFNKLFDVAQSGYAPFEYIIVDESSRIARNIQQALKFYSDLKFRGINVYCVAQGIDTAEKSAEAMLTLLGLLDAMSLSCLASETHRGIEGQFIKGFSPGARRYGYKSEAVITGKNDRYGIPEVTGYKIKIEPEQAKVIVRIFTMYGEQGYSAIRISNILNRELIKSGEPKPSNGQRWSKSTILNILNNDVYRGSLVWNRTFKEKNPSTGGKRRVRNSRDKWRIREDESLRIINDELWARCKEIRREIELKTDGEYVKGKKYYSPHLLTRISKCLCGGTYGIVSGGSYPKYGCTVYHNNGISVCRNSIKLSKEILEEAIILTISKELVKGCTPDLFCEIQSNLGSYLEKCCHEKKRESINEELIKIQTEINNIVDAIKGGFKSRRLRYELAEAERRRKELENYQSLGNCATEHLPQSFTIGDLKEYFVNLASELMNPDKTRDTLYNIVDEITISGNGQGSTIVVDIKESAHNFMSFLSSILRKRGSRIRFETGTGFKPYTSRVFQAKIFLSLDDGIISDKSSKDKNFFFLRRKEYGKGNQ